MLSDQIQRVFDTKWFSIDSVKVKDDNEPYYRINFPGGVVVLPVTVSGNLVHWIIHDLIDYEDSHIFKDRWNNNKFPIPDYGR